MKKEKLLKKGMGLWDLALFNIVAIVGLRWTAMAAGEGPSSLLLWAAAMFFFFIPSALVVVELSSRYPQEGGIYVWTKEPFGEFEGFMCGYCYWINNLIYYPNLLIYLSATFLYTGGSRFLHLEENPVYAVAFSLIVLWIAIILNMVGIKTGKWLHNLGGLSSWIPVFLLMAAGGVALWRYGSANVFAGNLIPDFKTFGSLSVFSALCFGFAGLELQACMGEEIENSKKNIPRAVFISGMIIASIYILATASLLVILPSGEINMISGVVQVIAKAGEMTGMSWIAPVIALLITIGGIGGCGAWLSGTARIPYVLGIDKYLPAWLGEVHPKWGTPANAILIQGVFSTLFILMTVNTSVKESYQMLVNATLILYFIPYIYMFLAFIAVKLKRTHSGSSDLLKPESEICNEDSDMSEGKKGDKAFNYPWWLGLAGLLSTALAIVISLEPPKDAGDPGIYLLKLVGGSLGFILLGAVVYLRGAKQKTDIGKRSLAASKE